MTAGAEPRVRLRYLPQAGTREETVLRSHTELQGSRLGVAGGLPTAPVLAELGLRALKDDGILEYEVLVGSVPTFAQPAHLSAKGELRISSRGIPVELELEGVPLEEPDSTSTLSGPIGILRPSSRVEPEWQMGPNLDLAGSDLRSAGDDPVLLALDRLIVPLPEAPVGLGAKWRVTDPQPEQGIRFHIHTEYELLAWRPAGAELRATSSLDLARTSLAVGPPGMPATLKNASATGSARYTIRFDRILAVGHADMATKIVFAMGTAEAPESEDMELRRRQALDLEPFGAQGLVAFPSWSIRHIPGLRCWQVNYCATLHGERNGSFETPGGIGARGSCVHGKPEGPWRSVEEAGLLSGEFTHGAPTGVWVQHGPGGETLGEFALQGGNGTVIAWWPGGKKRLEAELRNGKPDGRFATWHENGKPHMLGAFSAGEKSGSWTEYDPSGAENARWLVDPGCRIVDHVVPGSSAERAGIRPGDLVQAAGSTRVESGDGVRLAVEEAGTRALKLRLERQGKPVQVQVTPAPFDGRPRIGVVFACHRMEPSSKLGGAQ